MPKMQLAMTCGPTCSCLARRAFHVSWALAPDGTCERCWCSMLIQMYPWACWSLTSSAGCGVSTYCHSFLAFSSPIILSFHSRKLFSLSLVTRSEEEGEESDMTSMMEGGEEVW
jgi:hypothetical protein